MKPIKFIVGTGEQICKAVLQRGVMDENTKIIATEENYFFDAVNLNWLNPKFRTIRPRAAEVIVEPIDTSFNCPTENISKLWIDYAFSFHVNWLVGIYAASIAIYYPFEPFKLQIILARRITTPPGTGSRGGYDIDYKTKEYTYTGYDDADS